MSPKVSTSTVQPNVLPGALWLVGGVLLPVSVWLLVGIGLAVLALSIWCMATAVLIGRRR